MPDYLIVKSLCHWSFSEWWLVLFCLPDTPHPSNEEMNAIAETLNQDRSTVRFWFGNRRQKARKMSAIAAPTASFGAAALLPQLAGAPGGTNDSPAPQGCPNDSFRLMRFPVHLVK